MNEIERIAERRLGRAREVVIDLMSVAVDAPKYTGKAMYNRTEGLRKTIAEMSKLDKTNKQGNNEFYMLLNVMSLQEKLCVDMLVKAEGIL